MNMLAQFGEKQKTISTRLVAELTGKRINDANNAIERNAKKYNIQLPPPNQYKLHNGEHQRDYALDLSTGLALLSHMRADIGLKLFKEVLQNQEQALKVINALNDFEVPDDLPEMYVYYIQNKSTLNVKIGISRDPQKRLKQLQVGCDGELVLLGYKRAENRFCDESIEHKTYSANHIHGEWFDDSKGLIAAFAAKQGGAA